MRYKKAAVILAAVVLLIGAAYALFGNPVVFFHNLRLRQSIRAISDEQVSLNAVVPFEWDVVYTFAPYESKAQIEETVGFRSADIRENNINEGMVHLLFVRGGWVAASVLGYAENLGYRLEFSGKVRFADDAKFDVTRANGVVTLVYAG